MNIVSRISRRLLLVAAVAGLLALAAVAAAFWTTGATGSASAGAGSLSAPGKPSATASGGGIDLSWSAATVSSGSGIGYHVERRLSAGSAWSEACGSTAGAPISATNCTDSPGTTAAVVYRVTASFRSWSARGAESDAVTPVVAATVATVSSTLANGSYKAGQVVPVTVTFSAPVTVTGTPQLLLETGATDRYAGYAGGSGTSTLTFNYTVQAGDTSSDLDYVATSSLTLNGGTIRSGASIDADRTLPAPGAAGSLGANKAIVVDTTAPVVSQVSSTLADGSYKVGQVVPVTVTFAEPVTVTGSPRLLLETGATDRNVSYSSGSGTTTLVFNYTVQANDTSPDLNYQSTAALTLNGGTIRDAATNNATLTLPALASADALAGSKAIVVDTTAPTVTGVTSTVANGAYKAGATIPVRVSFSEPVDVSGSPQLLLETGATDRNATYTSGSGTTTLTFEYTIQAGDTSADLDYASTGALSLNGGTIRDDATNDANRTLASPGASGSLGANKAVVIDTTAPTVTSVSASTAGGSYGPGSAISIQVNFNQAVTVAGTPQLQLETGATDRTIDYASGSGTSVLTFTYTVQAGDMSADLDYVSASALSLNGGSIADAADNGAALTLPAPGSANSLAGTESLVIDTTAPTLQSLQFFDSDGNGKIDQLKATFNETLTSSGNTATPWSFAGTVPGNATKGASVTTSGSVATLSLAEGGVDTAPSASWQVSLAAASNGVRDLAGNQGSFSGQAPADKAGPALVTATSGGGTANRLQQNDTLVLTFSEALATATVPSSVTVTEQRSGGATLTIPNLIVPATIANGYLAANNSSGSASGSPVVRSLSNTRLTVTLGAVSTTGSGVATATGGGLGATIVPAASLTDAAGNAAPAAGVAMANLF